MSDCDNVIFFDGECKFCNSSVNFIIKRDSRNYFKFAPLQGELSKKINLFQSASIPDSIILIEKGKTYKFSDAALKIAAKLDGFWKLFYVFYIVPRPLRDLIYKYVAANRYKWFGKYDHCMIPDKSIIERFLE